MNYKSPHLSKQWLPIAARAEIIWEQSCVHGTPKIHNAKIS